MTSRLKNKYFLKTWWFYFYCQGSGFATLLNTIPRLIIMKKLTFNKCFSFKILIMWSDLSLEKNDSPLYSSKFMFNLKKNLCHHLGNFKDRTLDDFVYNQRAFNQIPDSILVFKIFRPTNGRKFSRFCTSFNYKSTINPINSRQTEKSWIVTYYWLVSTNE